MAERLADIVDQINNVHQLGAVVGAMRGIAASRALQSRGLVAGIRAHAGVVSEAIGKALSLLPPMEQAPPGRGHGRMLLLLFCAEQGFAGAFSERVLDAAGQMTAESTIFVIGRRGRRIAVERGIQPIWSTAMATRVGMIPALANRISEAVYDHVASADVTRAAILFPASEPGHISVVRRMLLPVDMEGFARANLNQPPLITLRPQVLLERLAAEYVFVQICEAAMSAFAAENEARMLAMSAAKENVSRKLGELQRRERQLRQEEITNEVIELAAGTDALIGRRPA